MEKRGKWDFGLECYDGYKMYAKREMPFWSEMLERI